MLISISLLIVTFVSFYEDIKISDYTLKKAPIVETLLKDELRERIDSIATASIKREMEKKLEESKTDSLPQILFIFGDSMTYNLALRLAEYAKMNGHEIYSVNWDSSNTKIWSEHETLSYYINKYHPTQIYVSLGSNELYYKDPQSRRPYIEKIIQMIDTIPFVWIGPPSLKMDNGLNDMLEEICGPGRFFRTSGLELARRKDKIHPTKEASSIWVDSIMRWTSHSAHPYVVDTPDDSIGRQNPNIVFLKALNK